MFTLSHYKKVGILSKSTISNTPRWSPLRNLQKVSVKTNGKKIRSFQLQIDGGLQNVEHIVRAAVNTGGPGTILHTAFKFCFCHFTIDKYEYSENSPKM